MRHALYVERDGAGRDGDDVQVFDRDHEQADGAAFVERCEGDRHHFRVIISPESGAEITDLQAYTRELVERVERDLGTRLDWIAAEHHDTGRPHIHLLIRGKHPDGRDLVIPREYVSHRFRERAEGLATELLGPRREPDRLGRMVNQERFTALDRELIARARGSELRLGHMGYDGPSEARAVQRLNRLEGWGLAAQTRPGVWKLDADLKDKLIRLSDIRDRERATTRLLAREDRAVDRESLRHLEAAHSSQQRMVGRLIGFERLGDDHNGAQLIGIEGVDGNTWTARVARLEDLRPIAGVGRGAIIEIERATPEVRPADRTIWAVAAENNLTYSEELHRASRPTDRDEYIAMHERRLEALRRDGIVTRDHDGTFRLPQDYMDRAAAREGVGGRESVRVTLHDPQTLEQQVNYKGPTWLDRVSFNGEAPSQMLNKGFGREVQDAYEKREATLVRLDLAERRPDGLYLNHGWRDALLDMEDKTLRAQIERESGRIARVARDGDKVHGVFVSRIHMGDQSYARIDDFSDRLRTTLVPWRGDMDRALNQFVSGRVNGERFDFQYGKGVEQKIRGLGLDIGGR
jgi:type IV secretory pathway VirD2 relaxase